MHHNEQNSLDEAQPKNLLLSLAAMFQGKFSIDWLVELTDEKPSTILSALEEGTEKGWLTRENLGLYTFSNKKKRRSVIRQLDKSTQEQYHRKIADLLFEELSNDEQIALKIADHLLHTRNAIGQCSLLMQAGDLKLKSFQYEEALQCYNKVLEDLTGNKDEASHEIFIQTAIRYSKLSMARYDTDRVLSILHEAMDRAKIENQPAYDAILKMYLAKNQWLRGQTGTALKTFEQAWNMAQKIENPQLMRSATAFRIFFYYWQGRFQNVIRVFESTAPDVERIPYGRFPLLASMMAGYCYWICGNTTQGMGMIDSIRSYCRERGDNYSAVYADNCMGEIMLRTGRRKEAIEILESVSTEASKERITWMWLAAKSQLAYAYYLNNDLEKAGTYFKEWVQKSGKRRVQTPTPYTFELYWASANDQLPRFPGFSMEKFISKFIRGKDVCVKGIAYRYQAVLYQNNNSAPRKILQSLNHSQDCLEESGYQIEIAKTRIELARQYLLMGDEKKAREITKKASKVLADIEDDLIPDELKSLLPKHSGEEGLLKEIMKLSQEAVTIRDNKELVQHIISTVNRITGAERGALFLWDKTIDPPKLELRASKGITVEEINHQKFKSSMKLIKKIGDSGKGYISGEGKSDKPTRSSRQAIRSRICVPLILRDQVIGVLYHDNRLLTSAFKESDLELLAYFASQAAIALDNSEAYETIQRKYRQVSEEKLYFEEQHLQTLHFDDIVGESPAIRKVLSQVEQVAETDATVLILGETGVGKELVASAIHRHSSRNKGPFIRVQCSALPESLIPSELFGHEKGAFTGATQQRIGRFELADGGTIFLDEIGDLAQDVQVRLLRVLQSKEFERIGGAQTIRSDFRLIAATNRALDKEVKAGNFRSDLFYRLNVFPINVPPLRKRMEDTPLLAHYFLKIYSDKMGKTFSGIHKTEMNKLFDYDWPGNVRELENIIERSTILSREPNFTIPGLKSTSREILLPLKEIERQHILKVLQKTNWRIRGDKGAAKILELKPTTLEFRIKKLGLKRPAKPSRP